MSTITLRRGDVALVYFPSSDLVHVKLRPVLVVQADDLATGIPQLLVAMVSSNLRRAAHPARVVLSLNDPLSAGTGLKLDSIVMGDNLATITLSLFRARIGRVPDLTQIEQGIRTALAL